MENIGLLFGLFVASFLAATILPAQSEIMLGGMVLSGEFNVYIVLAAAITGNVLGSCLNYYIGMYLDKYRKHKYFPVKERLMKKAEKKYQKYGPFTLLFAWLPVVGDPLTFIAGFFKTNFWLFLILVTFGKSVRYVLIAWFAYHNINM